jgi:hypothetical protein
MKCILDKKCVKILNTGLNSKYSSKDRKNFSISNYNAVLTYLIENNLAVIELRSPLLNVSDL